MHRPILFTLAALHMATGVFIFVTPGAWYEATPGVPSTGPLNTHFARDVGLAFIASGGGLALGAIRRNSDVALIGAAWPAMHAIFHIWIWIHRGFPADLVAAVNLFGLQAPAWLGVWAAFHVSSARAQS